jgi:phosphonopyruvate decarboxylase
MIDPGHFVERLQSLGVTMYTGVPDSLLKQFGKHVMAALPREQHVITANEGAAVGLALGHYLRTARPALVYLQNSGFGNTVNPLLSLADADVYGTPMLLLVGWRGQPGVKDEPQHVKQGRVMTDLVEAMDLPWAVLPTDPEEADAVVEKAVATAEAGSTPYVLLVEKGTFADAAGDEETPSSGRPSREDALIATADAIGDGPIIISTTGMLSRELFEHRERTGGDGTRDFLTVGGMGHASSIALGVALQEPDREVWCLDGDGAMLMHQGTFAVIADHAPRSFFHVVFNNGVHDSVGGQPTSIEKVDVPAAALAMGYRHATSVDELDQVADAIAGLREAAGPSLLEVRVRPGNRPGIGRPTRTPAESKAAFMAAVRTDGA